MNRYREVFKTDKAYTVVVGDKVPRFIKTDEDSIVHVAVMSRGDGDRIPAGLTFHGIEGYEVLMPTFTVGNKEVPSIIDDMIRNYPDEHVYILIKVIGPEDMSELGFACCKSKLVFNSSPVEYDNIGQMISSDGNKYTQQMLEDTHNQKVDLPIVEYNNSICSGCLEEISPEDTTNHCSCCNQETHIKCLSENGMCYSCNDYKGRRFEDKVLSMLRVSCMKQVVDSLILKDDEKEALKIKIKRANGLQDLNFIASRFNTTSVHSLPEISRRRFTVEETEEILIRELDEYKKRVKLSLASGSIIPTKGMSGVMRFMLESNSIDRKTMLKLIDKLMSPEWVMSIGRMCMQSMYDKAMYSFVEPKLPTSETKTVERLIG